MIDYTKVGALRVIVADVHSDRMTKASYKRVKSALRTLGFEGDDLEEALMVMEYHSLPGAPKAFLLTPGE